MAKSKKPLVKPKKPVKRTKPEFRLLALFCLGLMLIAAAILIKVHNANKLSFTAEIPLQQVVTEAPKPVRVTIPSVTIDLPLFETSIEKGTWQIAPDGASHLAASKSPGQNGNIIIYAHNTANRFGRLKKVKNGDVITVTTTDGASHRYKVSSTTTVNPNQVALLSPTHTEVLTIYTCTGFADTKRLVIQAIPA